MHEDLVPINQIREDDMIKGLPMVRKTLITAFPEPPWSTSPTAV